MVEDYFFAALRDHLSAYTVTITYNSKCPLAPYAVELFARGQSFRCASFLASECFVHILDTLGIHGTPAPVPGRYSDAALDLTAPAPEAKRGKTSPK